MTRRGLGWQLGIAFALVAAATALLAAAMLSTVWQRQFESYVRQGLKDNADGYALSAARLYVANRGWPSSIQVRVEGMNPGVRLQLFDESGGLILDSADTIRSAGVGDRGGAVPPPSDALGAVSAVVVGGRTVGLVKVWSQSAGGLMSPRDVAFRLWSLWALAAAAVLAVLLASAAGVLYARRLARPIGQVTATAAALRSGRLDARTGMSGDDPVGTLGRTLDEMADAIAADREFERRLTADVAHELRTPLQAIQATVEAMQDGVLPADERRLETVRDETMRLARLAESILELARLERGAVPMRREPIDLAVPLVAAIDTHRALMETAGLTLDEDVEHGVTVAGDADRLTQAFGNLLSNAARYTPVGGTVRVRLAREGGDAVVSVSDTGIGIAEEDLPRVFVRFWRADAARSRATGGLGVGLAVVREIVDRHGGRVSVSSRPGAGTTFVVHLPLPLPVTTQRPRSGFLRQ